MKWRALPVRHWMKVQLEASEPDFDGSIQVEALVNTVSEAVFLLANPEPTCSAFTAYFDPNGPGEFSVWPGSGVMPAGPPRPLSPGPARGDPRASVSGSPLRSGGRLSVGGGVSFSGEGGEGVEFAIAYAPSEYGKDKIGRLIIQTEEMQWVFEVGPGGYIVRHFIQGVLKPRLLSHTASYDVI